MLWGERGGGRGGRAIIVLLSVFLQEDAKGNTDKDKHGTRIIKLITRPRAREETRPTTRYRHGHMHSTVCTLSGPWISTRIHHQRDHMNGAGSTPREREREREIERERERDRQTDRQTDRERERQRDHTKTMVTSGVSLSLSQMQHTPCLLGVKEGRGL
jgi:hypothetical protein